MTERPKVHNFGQYCALLGDLEQTVIIFLCIVNFQEPQLGSLIDVCREFKGQEENIATLN